MSKIFQTPRWTVSYRGEVEYEIGPSMGLNGSPSVRIRHHLSPSQICYLNNPDDFWRLDIQCLGVILWNSCPWIKNPSHHFPDPEVAAMFPGYPPGRYNQNWEIEIQDDFPQLALTPMGFEPLSEYDATNQSDWNQILWQGTAPEMTKEFWFEMVFPRLYPTERSRIIQHLIRKQVHIPSHPPLPDTPYSYRRSGSEWQVRLDRTYLPVLFYNKSLGWVERETEATVFHREIEAKQAVDHLKEHYEAKTAATVF